MKTAYIDTNVLISKIKPDDPFHSAAVLLFNEPYVRNITSSLFLVELKSVISKQVENLEENLPEEGQNLIKDLNYSSKVDIFFNYLLNTSQIEIIENIAIEKLTLESLMINMPASYSIALRIAKKTLLKTLDNLHLAHTLLLKRNKNLYIDYFITGDKMLLNRKKDLNKIIGITILNPQELESVEG